MPMRSPGLRKHSSAKGSWTSEASKRGYDSDRPRASPEPPDRPPHRGGRRPGYGNEGDIVGTTLIVVDDSCPPATECDPHLPFDAIVVFVTAGGDTTGWYAYRVVATDTSVPEKAERWQNDIHAHIVDRIRAALATP